MRQENAWRLLVGRDCALSLSCFSILASYLWKEVDAVIALQLTTGLLMYTNGLLLIECCISYL